MNIVVAIIVYNRYENLKRWLHCWQKCNHENAELVVIHTGIEIEKFKALCVGITYIHRQNIGFDIGSFQDVCRERLAGFPNNWDYLIWATDDTFPMITDFIKPFIETIQKPEIGLSCMQISASKPGNVLHVRTTGFCITKEMSLKLRFPVDPVKTKQDCYLFEHRGGKNTLSEQVREMGLSCEQVAPNISSPLWDSGYWKRLDRQAEHDRVFGNEKKQGDKVTFICTIYNSYPQIISSLLLQTHKNWELILIHDGPSSNGMLSYIGNDPRIKYIETKERKGKWGHSYRQWALEEIRAGRLSDPDYIVITNADNYYVPEFLKYMLHGIKTKHTSVASYCSHISHSYISFGVMTTKIERGFIDCGAVMVKKDIACEVGWRDIESHSADWVYFSDIASKYSPSNFIKVPGLLFVHN